MNGRMRQVSYSAARLLWLVYGIFLWVFWLVSIPEFLRRAGNGVLPTTEVDGLSPAARAMEGAAAWGISVGDWSWISTFINVFSFLVFSLVALLIWWRVRTGFGLLTAFVLLVGGSNVMNMAVYSAELWPAAVAAWQLGAIIWPLFFIWLYLFPNGRAVPRRILWLFGPMVAAFGFLYLLYDLTIFAGDESLFERAITGLQPLVQLLIPLLIVLVVGAQVYRYARVSGGTEKEQTKWFLLGLLIAFVPLLLAGLVWDFPGELDTIAFIALPIGIGISVLRYRLWDIDVIIRKTLVYAVLTGLLALVYFGSVVLLQQAFGRLTGVEQSPLAIVISTLVIAALFTPLRRRIQDWIDRRFFRKKYNAQQVLAAFALHARDETDLDALTAELVRVVQETMQPEHVSVWLLEKGGK